MEIARHHSSLPLWHAPSQRLMSEMGQTRTFNHVGATSALPLVTAKWRTLLRVRNVPTSEVAANKNLGT
jgi:hypothetical protein